MRARESGPGKRRLTLVLLRITLLLTLSLGVAAALVQLWIDLQQEKEAVEVSAEEFLTSVAPSAASAAYNFYDEAAEQVVEGLFTQRAIAGVTIVNEGEVMISRQRDVSPTLPPVGNITSADEVTLALALYAPPEAGIDEVIGSISITVDRSVVPPAIVNRMFSYFLLATLKNFVLGVMLIALVYGALARYIINLADAAGRWTPQSNDLSVPKPPGFLLGTEVDVLGARIQKLAGTASDAIRQIEASREAIAQSNSELSEKSEQLSQAVEERTKELKSANERLKRLAERDGLTGLFNRRSFDKQASQMFEAVHSDGETISVLLIDVDQFKAYNDFYGHQAGDQVLVRLSKTLLKIAQSTGCLVSRYGGEEFVALGRDKANGSAAELADKIHAALEAEDIEHQRSTISTRVTVSIGTATAGVSADDPCESLGSLLSGADEALYEAKRDGRNQTVASTKEIRGRVQRQRLAARALLDAVEAREFIPFLQPQFDARSGRLVGAEALVRWQKPSGHIVAPPAFLDAAVESGLVPFIDGILLDKVTEFLDRCKAQKLLIPRISLNVTSENVRNEEYVVALLEVVKKSQSRLTVELHETAFLDKPDQCLLDQLGKLRSGGIGIEIDDFGTGRTSIVGLMAIRPHRVKIAKEIVMPLREHPEQTAVITSVIQISKALGIDVLAEGIETEEVAQRLVELGCEYQQGFYHGRPTSVDVFVDRFRHHLTSPADADGCSGDNVAPQASVA